MPCSPVFARALFPKLSDAVFTVLPNCTARAWLGSVLLSALAVGALPAAQAQNSGSLPIYRCVAADGMSSRISRTPCAAAESGKAQQAVAGTAKQKPATAQLAPSVLV